MQLIMMIAAVRSASYIFQKYSVWTIEAKIHEVMKVIQRALLLSSLGEGLFMPALNAFFLDITRDQYRTRGLGFKEAMFSLAGLSGPSLVVLVRI